jgi:hypothetical protein
MSKVLAALLVLGSGLAMPAHARLIVVEPDNFAVGQNLSGISPHVALSHGYSTADPSFADPVYAISSPFAPTGSLVFGSGPSGPGGFAFVRESQAPGNNAAWGFAMSFSQPVTNISLFALNFGYPPGLALEGWALDASGAIIDSFIYTPALGLGSSFNFALPSAGVKTLVIGGEDGIGALLFDRLAFEVPEPGPLALLALGVVVLGVFVRRRRPAAQLTAA